MTSPKSSSNLFNNKDCPGRRHGTGLPFRPAEESAVALDHRGGERRRAEEEGKEGHTHLCQETQSVEAGLGCQLGHTSAA